MLLHTIWLARKNDVIHAHWTLNGIIAGIAGIVTGRPVVTTIRGEDANRIQTSRFQRYLLRLCLKLSYAVATVSRAIDEQLLAKYPDSADKLHFIPNGVSEVLFSIPVADAKPELIILVLGSLIPRKGVDLILAAAAACKDKAWRIIIAGTGPEEAKLRALSAAQGIEERIFFIGQIEPERVPELLSTAHILIQASYSEGRPNTVLEAMAAAIPVIGSDIDGINELITHEKNGLLFPAGDVKTLATQLNRLLNVPELRRQLGQAGRKTLQEQHLTWPQCAATYAALYEEAVN
jgi:glycosyltransferase involved in cell wall biosynthesis